MYKFQTLFTLTRKSLYEEKVSAQELISHIQCLGATKPTYNYTGNTPLQCILLDLQNAETCTTGDIMSAVNNYCSFFNYQMLEHIIDEFGTEQDKKNLKNYKAKFDQYAKCCVIECPVEFGKPNEGHIDMIVILDDSFNGCRVSHLHIFITKLRNILKIESDVELRLCRIDPGCIKITFQMPCYVQQAIFGKSFSVEQEAALADLGVVELTCGDYRFTRPLETEVEDVDKRKKGDIKLSELGVQEEESKKQKNYSESMTGKTSPTEDASSAAGVYKGIDTVDSTVVQATLSSDVRLQLLTVKTE